MVVLPETDVYVVPDVAQDIFFYNGFWWRPWEGRWYRSQYYNSGWGYYQGVPSFYGGIPSGWRNEYRNHSWKGIGETTKGYLTNRFNKTGGAGNRVSIGRINKRGGVQGLRSRTQSQQQTRESGQQFRGGQQQQGNHEGVKGRTKALTTTGNP